MVGNTSQFQNVTPYNTEEHVTVGNEEGLNITNLVGTTNLSCANSTSLNLPFFFFGRNHSIYHMSFMFHNSRLISCLSINFVRITIALRFFMPLVFVFRTREPRQFCSGASVIKDCIQFMWQLIIHLLFLHGTLQL